MVSHIYVGSPQVSDGGFCFSMAVVYLPNSIVLLGKMAISHGMG